MNPRNFLKLNIQLNAVQCRRMQHNTAQYSSMQFEQIIEYAYVLQSARSTMNLRNSVQLNAAQCNSIQFNADERSSIDRRFPYFFEARIGSFRTFLFVRLSGAR